MDTVVVLGSTLLSSERVNILLLSVFLHCLGVILASDLVGFVFKYSETKVTFQGPTFSHMF